MLVFALLAYLERDVLDLAGNLGAGREKSDGTSGQITNVILLLVIDVHGRRLVGFADS